MLMTIFGQNYFLECLRGDSPNLLDYYDVQSTERYPTESFSQAKILEKQWRFEFSKINQKIAWLPWQHT